MVPRPHLQAVTGRQEALSGQTAAPFTADLHQASHRQAVQAHHTAAVLQAIHTAAAVLTGAQAVLTEVPVAATPEAEFHVLPAEVPAEQSGDINGNINYDKYEKTDNSNSSARGICC